MNSEMVYYKQLSILREIENKYNIKARGSFY
jgi:hypothetical protein